MDFKNLSGRYFDVYKDGKSTVHGQYWENFMFPVTMKEPSTVTHISCSSANPKHFALTCSSMVKIYDMATREVLLTYSGFKTIAYSGNFRADGQLVIAGSEEGTVMVYDTIKKNPLRIFEGHSAPVHCCNFMHDNVRIVSFGDDKVVALWDVPSEKIISSYKEHNDYIRAGTTSQCTTDIVLSGSYDHTVKMYDCRTNRSVLTVDHGAPVESLLIFPSGNAFISVGGLEVRVWDAVGGGKMIAKLSQHHKTITDMSFGTNCGRLLTCSMDKHIKIYDVVTYKVLHTLNFPSPIRSFGVGENDSALIVGMTNGLLSMQIRKEETTEAPKPKTKYSLRCSVSMTNDKTTVVTHETQQISHRCDVLLRRFQPTKALKQIMMHEKDDRQLSMAVIQELIHRGCLAAAVYDGNIAFTVALVQFIINNICDPKYSRLMLDFANTVFAVYGNEILSTKQLKSLVSLLRSKIEQQICIMQEMMELKGMMEMITSASQTKAVPVRVATEETSSNPEADDQQ